MLFHSYIFIFLFLPITLAGYFALSRPTISATPALLWLVAASLVFYSYWNIEYTLILVASVLCNFAIIASLNRIDGANRSRFAVFIFGIVSNLLFLGYFKYTNFFIQNINALFGSELQSVQQTFPVGISFYTFIQIGCLVDAYNGQVEKLKLPRYLLFGMFFPYITAGPLVQQREMFQQMETRTNRPVDGVNIAAGLTMFFMGLFKKVIFADTIAPYANGFFQHAASGDSISAAAAWLGVALYTLQLYFDFSGYSDMAIGLGCIFGLRLPLNFNSPLKATNIIDFWRRWHMTMTRFFTNYIYTPFAAAGMRRSMRKGYSTPRRLLAVVVGPVIITFTLAGLWHGPGWGFVIFGIIHGLALAANHSWRAWRAARAWPNIPSVISWLLTVFVFMVSLVSFRSDSIATAMYILQALSGLNQAAAAGIAEVYGAETLFQAITIVPAVFWLIVLAAIVLLFPNTQEILGDYDVALDAPPDAAPYKLVRFTWKPNLAWAITIGIVSLVALSSMGDQSPFLYYQF